MTVSNDPPESSAPDAMPSPTSWPNDDYSPAADDGSTTGGLSDAKNTAQEQAAKVKDTATGEAQAVAQTVKEQTQAVTSDVRAQARDLVDQSRGQLNEQASSQRDRAVTTLRSLADELSGMADSATSSGLGQQLTREGGQLTHKAADFLEQREPSELLGEVRDLARSRPGAFLIGAALAGVVAGRLSRGAMSLRSSDDDAKPATYPAPGNYAADLPSQPVVTTSASYPTDGTYADDLSYPSTAGRVEGDYPSVLPDPSVDPGGLR